MDLSPSKVVFNHVTFDENIHEQYLCDVCKNPLLDAELVIPCGHTFCGFCVKILKSENSGKEIKCEKCRDPVKAFCKNHLANNFLSMVDGECKWCKGTFPLHSARDHIEICPEIGISCKQCRIAIKRKERDSHEATCPMADVLCGCGVTYRRVNEESHKERTCSLTEVPCPLHCGKNIKRYLIPSHTMDCGAGVTVCAIKGCEETIRRENLKDHNVRRQM